ncbi:MAG: 4'-phosphopantetheinyl transferase superfamily protein [Clostridiales bacterium]|nr:4'-phosphopantetheinyl transferase superfamily protein [Clostridiales bacterium]
MIRLYLTSCDKSTEHNIGAMLARYALRQTFGNESELIYDERGKPCVNGNVMYVSISHSNELCAAAVSDSELGVDIEYIDSERPIERLDKLAQRYFTPDEYVYVNTQPNPNFYRIWTAKESYVKYTGEGLSRRLGSFSVLTLPLVFNRCDFENYAGCICSAESCKVNPIIVDKSKLS